MELCKLKNELLGKPFESKCIAVESIKSRMYPQSKEKIGDKTITGLKCTLSEYFGINNDKKYEKWKNGLNINVKKMDKFCLSSLNVFKDYSTLDEWRTRYIVNNSHECDFGIMFRIGWI